MCQKNISTPEKNPDQRPLACIGIVLCPVEKKGNFYKLGNLTAYGLKVRIEEC